VLTLNLTRAGERPIARTVEGFGSRVEHTFHTSTFITPAHTDAGIE
jgi:hypothetical protein